MIGQRDATVTLLLDEVRIAQRLDGLVDARLRNPQQIGDIDRTNLGMVLRLLEFDDCLNVVLVRRGKRDGPFHSHFWPLSDQWHIYAARNANIIPSVSQESTNTQRITLFGSAEKVE